MRAHTRLRLPNTPRAMGASQQHWTHYLVLDFEATCERNDPTQKEWSEIIEFPCVLLDARTLERVAEFRSLVKPTQRPQVSAFCTELTSITQDQVDGAPTLTVVLKNFCIWLANVLDSEDTSTVLPVTCGEPDLASMLPRECARKRLRVPGVLSRWCNIKRIFSAHTKTKPGGMTNMLKHLQIPLAGRHHLGIDDARNIASIVVRLHKLGASVTQTGGEAPASSTAAPAPTPTPTEVSAASCAQPPAAPSAAPLMPDAEFRKIAVLAARSGRGARARC